MAHTYTLTAGDVIDKARAILQDNDSLLRTEDAEMFTWLDDALSALLTLVPSLFISYTTHTCVAGSRQALDTDRARGFIGVVGTPPANWTTLEAFAPGWSTGASGTIEHWLRAPNDDPLSFWCYPPAEAGQSLPLMIAQAHDVIASLSDVISVPETYAQALACYVAASVMDKEDETVNMERATALKTQFVALVKGAA